MWTCVGKMQSFILVDVPSVTYPTDVVHSRQWKARVVDFARQSQVHASTRVVVERVVELALRSLLQSITQSVN